MTPWGFGVDPDQEKLERLRRGLEGLHGVVKSAVVDPLTLPGDVVAGKFNTAPSVPGFWSDEDEARAQLNDRAALGRTIDLGGAVMTSTLPAVAAHVAQHGTKGLTNPDTLGIFAGAGALTADANKLATAQRMAKEGATPSDIWDATGWFQGADKKWRFEIDDSKAATRGSAGEEFFNYYDNGRTGMARDARARISQEADRLRNEIKNGRMTKEEAEAAYSAFRDQWRAPIDEASRLAELSTTLKEEGALLKTFSHPDLYAAYPDTRKIQSDFDVPLGDNRGVYYANVGKNAPEEIRVSRNLGGRDGRSTILHEAQHAIQNREGFASGGSPTDFLYQNSDVIQHMRAAETPLDAYKRLAGEVEARNVQARRDMSPDERQAIPPWRTQDTPFDQQIVRFVGDKSFMSPVWSPFDNAGVYREKALRDAERGGGTTRMFPSQPALDRWRGVTPAKAGTWESDVANAKAGFGAAVGDAREIMNDARAAVQSWGTRADDEAFLRDNMAWSTGDVQPFGALAPEGERIVGAAFRHGDQTFTGVNHGDAYENAMRALGFDPLEAGTSVRGANAAERQKANGFLTSTGRFVDRKEAARIANAADQAYGQQDSLMAHHLKMNDPNRQLPMDEASRLARAAEQGFTIDAYKGGQPYDWRTMPDRNWRGEIIHGTENRVPQEIQEINTPDRPYAGFFTNTPAVADRFAAGYENGSVWPVKLKFENPLVIDAKGRHAADFQFESLARQRGTLDEMQAFQDALTSGKHDGVILKNTKDEGDVYVPRMPSQVRSRFAAFDPKKKESGNLLASVAGVAGLDILRRYGLVEEE